MLRTAPETIDAQGIHPTTFNVVHAACPAGLKVPSNFPTPAVPSTGPLIIELIFFSFFYFYKQQSNIMIFG
jgi:hypothetical protein